MSIFSPLKECNIDQQQPHALVTQNTALIESIITSYRSPDFTTVSIDSERADHTPIFAALTRHNTLQTLTQSIAADDYQLI